MAIKSRIIPIIGPSIRWATFLKDTLDLVGRSPIREIDASGLKLDNYAQFIAALGEFQNSEANPIDTLRNNKTVLYHLHFSFLFVSSSELILKINELTELNTISTKIKGGRVALVSGSLADWRQLTIELCKDVKYRQIGKNLLDSFFQFGLQYIFSGEERQSLLAQ